MSSKKTAKSSSSKKKDTKGKTKVELDKVQEIVIDPALIVPPTITWPEPLPHSPGSVYQPPKLDWAVYQAPEPPPEPPEPAWAAVMRHSLETVVEVLSETTLSVAELHNRIRVIEEARPARAPQSLHTVHKLAAGRYEYRGAHISQDGAGAWLVRFEDGTESAGLTTLRLARALIDQALLSPEPVRAPDEYGDRTVPLIDRPAYFDVDSSLDHVEVVPVLEDLGEDFFEPVTLTNLTAVKRQE